MQPPQADPKDEVNDGKLLAQLSETDATSLRAGVAKVEGISKSDEENHGRWLKSVRKRIITKLGTWFLHFLFFVVCGIVLFIVAGTLWLTYSWVSSFVDKPNEVKSLLGRIWEVGLVAMATLFIQNVWPKD